MTAVAMLGLFCLVLSGCMEPEAAVVPMSEDEPVVRAPELEPNRGWINTDRPLRLKHELRGHVVLLDFWTYCCINCMHILPDLEFLEEKYADQPFVVVGVHSAKFDNEENRETIEAAVRRYNIKHPVVIDDDMEIWNRYTVQAWPTFVLIDSRGRAVGMTSGEGNRDVLDAAITKMLEQGRTEGTLAEGPVKINAGEVESPGTLAFPGKLLADEAGGRLFIADSNHCRIVVTTLPGTDGKARLISTIGSGRRDREDGSFEAASFDNPQGLALVGDTLYVADTDNHLIRAVDLATSTVRTVSGTGQQGYDRRGGKAGTEQEIASPWDLEYDEERNRLFVAMAGTHQVWTYDLGSGVAQVYAGSGRENIVDGRALEANLAQPSGLALLDHNLFVADSEVSAIRRVHAENGGVTTVVGLGLFVFGDVDGRGDAVRLQHVLGVAVHGKNLLIADTYNHKIKQVNPVTKEVSTMFGTGKPGRDAGGRPAFFEPAGLEVAGGHLYVADTNNHRVVVIHLETGNWSEVVIEGLEAPEVEEW